MTGRTWRPPTATALALLLLWWGLLAIANARWVERSVLALPPPWDTALQQLVGLRVFQALQESGWAAAWNEMHARSPFGPVFFSLSSIPLYWAFGPTRAVAHATTSLYLLLHLTAVFFLARRLHDDRAALFAVFLFSTFGAVVNLSRDYLADFPAAAFVALALLALASSDGLWRPRSTTAFGAFAGLAAVTKSMAPLFIVGPLCYVLATHMRRGRIPRMVSVSLAVATAALVALPWWGRHAGAALWYLWHYGMGTGASAFAPAGERVLSLRNVTYYGVALVNEGASLPMAAIAIGVAAASLSRARAAADPSPGTKRLLYVWLAAGYVVLTLSVNKAPDRYSIFLLTPVAVLLAADVAQMGRGRAFVVVGAITAGLWSWTAWTLDGAWAPPVVYYRPPFGLQAFRPHHAWIRSTLDMPEGTWPVEEAVRGLSALAPQLKHSSSDAYVARHDPTVTPERQVRAIFLGLLGREPDDGALLAYGQQLRGGRAPLEIMREIAASDEFRRRPLRVAVEPDEPVINVATLNYYAAAQRASISFFALSETPEPLGARAIDAVVVAEQDNATRGDRGRRLATAGGSGERMLALSCPDGRVLAVYASRPESAPATAEASRQDHEDRRGR